MIPQRYSRPKSKKEQGGVEDKSHDEGERTKLAPLKTLWDNKSGSRNRRGHGSNLVKNQSRKAAVVVPPDTPKPIGRRTKLVSDFNDDMGVEEKKKGLIGKMFKSKNAAEFQSFSVEELDSITMPDETNEKLPGDFEYDLKLYNSPQSKGIKSPDGKLRMTAHPCFLESEDLEAQYRAGNKPEAIIPDEARPEFQPNTSLLGSFKRKKVNLSPKKKTMRNKTKSSKGTPPAPPPRIASFRESSDDLQLPPPLAPKKISVSSRPRPLPSIEGDGPPTPPRP